MNIDFLKICSDVTKTAMKIPQSQYLSSGQYPIFDQGQKTISGYSNDVENVANDFPYIVFGDHTRVLKYVNEPCYIGADGVKLLKIINNDFDTKYVFYALLANPVNSQGYSRHFKFLKERKIKFVSKKEQCFIVEKLDLIRESIELKENELKWLDELIKSRFIEMFETIDLSEQRSNWKELGLVSKIYTGTTPSTKEPKNWDGDVLWITPAEMNQDTFYVYDTVRKITEIGRKSKSLDLMPVNTVLLSTRAPIGKVGIVGKPMACNQGFKNFECSSEVNPVFLYTLLKNNTDYLNSLGSGTTFLEVSKSRISKMLIPVPSIELQNQFESYIKLIDKLKFIVQEQIKNLQELFDKKMDEYFGE